MCFLFSPTECTGAPRQRKNGTQRDLRLVRAAPSKTASPLHGTRLCTYIMMFVEDIVFAAEIGSKVGPHPAVRRKYVVSLFLPSSVQGGASELLRYRARWSPPSKEPQKRLQSNRGETGTPWQLHRGPLPLRRLHTSPQAPSSLGDFYCTLRSFFFRLILHSVSFSPQNESEVIKRR